jgi:hypothetical protein
MENLDGDVGAETEVLRFVHGAHSASADQREDSVLPGQSGPNEISVSGLLYHCQPLEVVFTAFPLSGKLDRENAATLLRSGTSSRAAT